MVDSHTSGMQTGGIEQRRRPSEEARSESRPKHDDDPKKAPLGEKAPGAPFAVVALTYPIVLVVALILLAIVLWLFSA